MNFCIRTDDFAWSCDALGADSALKKKDAGLKLARRFHAAMQGLPYLAAVIPSSVDSEGLAWLQSQPAGMTVALHGWDHSYSPGGVASEFHECDFDQCRLRISAGRSALLNVPVEHLVLPFNAYTPPLSEACYLEGIRWIWGGAGHDRTNPSAWPTPPPPYSVGRIGFVPSWAPTYAATLWRMGPEVPPLCETLPKILDWPGKAIIVLHITWEAGKSKDFDGVRWLVDLIGDRVISVNEYLKS